MKTETVKGDIATRLDLVLLVNTFYEKVQADELLAPVFSHVDWPKHLPTMYDFWCSIVFGDKSYTGNPFMAHKALAIDRSHFTRWLTLFIGTVDQLFAGERATELRQRAQTIAGVFQHRLGLME